MRVALGLGGISESRAFTHKVTRCLLGLSDCSKSENRDNAKCLLQP